MVSDEEYEKTVQKEQSIKDEICRLEHTTVGVSHSVQNFLRSHNSTELKSGITLAELIRRPELNYTIVKELDEERPELPRDVAEQVNINIKYDGYIRRQQQQVEQFKKLERKSLDVNFDYNRIKGLRLEAAQKLNRYHPVSIGQASRISGVSPADISVLLVYFEKGTHHYG